MLVCADCHSPNLIANGHSKKGKQRYMCNNCRSYKQPIDVDREVLEENVRLGKQKQLFQDKNRVERKAFREHARLDNTLEILNEKMIELLERHGDLIVTQEHVDSGVGKVLLAHLTDWHFNELISLPHNTYDFTVGSKRLQKYAHRIKQEALMRGIKHITLAMTGDFINSDRRLDEMMSMATNRTNATYLAFLLIEQFIRDINTVANIDIICVVGNESRSQKEYGTTKLVMSDNYDYTINHMLQIAFRGKDGVTIHNNHPSEQPIEILGQKILALHGDFIKSEGTQAKVTQIVGKFALRKVIIRKVIAGHVHSPNISDFFARSGSGCGSNTYNEGALHLVGRAGQNLHIIYDDNETIDSMLIDLQNTEGYDGYEIIDELEAYNAKCADKLRPHETILKIQI